MWIGGRMRMGGWGPGVDRRPNADGRLGPDVDKRPNADGRPSQSRILLYSRPGDSSCLSDPAALAMTPGAA